MCGCSSHAGFMPYNTFGSGLSGSTRNVLELTKDGKASSPASKLPTSLSKTQKVNDRPYVPYVRPQLLEKPPIGVYTQPPVRELKKSQHPQQEPRVNTLTLDTGKGVMLEQVPVNSLNPASATSTPIPAVAQTATASIQDIAYQEVEREDGKDQKRGFLQGISLWEGLAMILLSLLVFYLVQTYLLKS